MKKIMILSLSLFISSLALHAQEWQTNFEEAKKLATQENQNIVLVFQGSDWCAPCIKLDKEIFSSEAFQTYAQGNFVMLKADFPRKKKNRLDAEQRKHNNGLAESYNQQGIFPLVVVMDKNGKVLGQAGYEKIAPSEYINILTSFEK